MKVIDTCLLKIYRKMKELDLEDSVQEKKSKCKCGKNVFFFESTEVGGIITGGVLPIILGDNTAVAGNLSVFGKHGRIEVGRECYIGKNTNVWSAKRISIGDRVLISHSCNIFDNDTHPKDSKERNKHYMHILFQRNFNNNNLNEKEIIIEDDVWIGANCTILKGCKIGRNSIIGTGTIVTRDVPPNSIVHGNPMMIRENIVEK